MKKYAYSNAFFLRNIMAAVFLFCVSFHVQAQETDSLDTVKKDTPLVKVFYGMASFYADKFSGRRTATGAVFNQKKYTCACNRLPLGTWVRITNICNGLSVIAEVNDRLHHRNHRLVDLSARAAKKLKFISKGITRVKMEVVSKRNKGKQSL